MGIFEFVEKLQKRPEAYRRKILLIMVFLIMAIIVIVWLTTFNLDSAGGSKKAERGPFDFIKEDFKDFYGFFKNIAK